MTSKIEKKKMLDIMKQIEILAQMGWREEAIEIANIEIDNLRGITPLKCKNRLEDSNYCRKCHNLNCERNQNIVIVY